jgi:hypothetical protein
MNNDLNNAEEFAGWHQIPPAAEEEATSASQGTMRLARVKNLDKGTRDYPLADGSSLYLPMKHKNVIWPKIAESQISPALRTAERKGHIQLIKD